MRLLLRWTFRTVEWDDERLPLSLLKEEDHVRQTLAIVFDLHNHNRAIDPVQRRRDYMKAWRIAHGQGTPDSYMARKARGTLHDTVSKRYRVAAGSAQPLHDPLPMHDFSIIHDFFYLSRPLLLKIEKVVNDGKVVHWEGVV